MAYKTVPGSTEWIKWEDWLRRFAGKCSDWTIIAQADGFDHIGKEDFTETYGTLSYLAKYDEEILRKVMAGDTWSVHYEDQFLLINSTDSGVEAEFNPSTDEERSFVVQKPGLYDFPSSWRLCHSFEDYFDLRYDQNGQLVDPRTGETIVRIAVPATLGPVEMRTDYLQDYLAALGMVLIRQHDHRRHWNTPSKELPERGGSNGIVNTKWGCYRINFCNTQTLGVLPFSRLTCKDVVTPAKRAGSIGCHAHNGLRSIDYPEFIVERKVDGTLVKKVPNRDKLQPFVYFSPKVLKKYYDEPSKYSVGFGSPGYGSVSDIHGWRMPIGLSDEGLVFCWLGDIAKSFMPPEDVAHWHANNVQPRGTPSKSFVNSQLHGKFATEASLEERLIRGREQLAKAFKEKGLTVYRPYKGPHRHLEKALREPLLNEFPEFRECILNLTTIFIEYLDTSAFQKDLPTDKTKDSDGKRLSSISLLQVWLKEFPGIDIEKVDKLINSLRLLQMVRSKTGIAHGFSDSSFSEILTRLQISGTPSAREVFLATTNPLADSLEELCLEIGASDRLWWRHKRDSN